MAGRPTPEQLERMVDHKHRWQEFLASLGDDAAKTSHAKQREAAARKAAAAAAKKKSDKAGADGSATDAADSAQAEQQLRKKQQQQQRQEAAAAQQEQQEEARVKKSLLESAKRQKDIFEKVGAWLGIKLKFEQFDGEASFHVRLPKWLCSRDEFLDRLELDDEANLEPDEVEELLLEAAAELSTLYFGSAIMDFDDLEHLKERALANTPVARKAGLPPWLKHMSYPLTPEETSATLEP